MFCRCILPAVFLSANIVAHSCARVRVHAIAAVHLCACIYSWGCSEESSARPPAHIWVSAKVLIQQQAIRERCGRRTPTERVHKHMSNTRLPLRSPSKRNNPAASTLSMQYLTASDDAQIVQRLKMHQCYA